MKVTAENYDGMKAFALGVFERLNSELMVRLDPAAHPRFVIEALEQRSMTKAREGVRMMVGDMIEQSECLATAEIAEYDRALANRGLPTLTEMRVQFGRRIRSIMKRGRIRDEDEYYALRNVADAMPDSERATAWSMLDSFMMSGRGQ